MSSATMLRSYDEAALNNNQFVSSVSGKKVTIKGNPKVKSFGAIGLVVGMIVIFVLLFGTGNIIPSTISDRLVEETDVQYADAVKSKELVFQQVMYQGAIPKDTEELLKQSGVNTEYSENGEVVLKMGEKTITAENFINEVNNNVELYDAFTKATYSRAAYYFDESAQKVFRRIGTNRNNYNENSSFDDVMDYMVSGGSNIEVNSVSLVKRVEKDPRTGNEVVSYEYVENGTSTNSGISSDAFIEAVVDKNPSENATRAALFSADILKVADTISKEDRSSLFYLVFMENISKMKAGEGNSSKINEAMNFLFDSAENEVLDVKTGELTKVYGTALDSPSLYAVLSGERVDADKVENYSSDRILKTVENQVNVVSNNAIFSETIVSSSSKSNGVIGRFVRGGIEKASLALMELLEPTVSKSLVNNSFDSIRGIEAGEFLVEGAVNVGKSLAKASGASPGDANAITQYARLNTQILAMDAAVDRKNRSPFDITSKNTFLGSVVHSIAINVRRSSGAVWSGFSTIMNSTKAATLSLLPTAFADSENNYLTSFGDCETYSNIGAVGSAHCSEIATFDTSTLNDPFNDPGFIDFINNNTVLDSQGNRIVNRGSVLAQYIIYNNERTTPLGVVDGGILDSISNDSSSVSIMNNVLSMIINTQLSNESAKAIASGAAFVNSSSNPNWQTYKYAQRYVSLARATASLKQYSSNDTAYQNLRFFEGDKNPVVAFLDEYYTIASR